MGVWPSPLFFPVILTQAASDLVWKTVDETKIIPVDPNDPLDLSLFDKYDICITGAAMKQYESRPAWLSLVQNTWVYARASPAQKEFILTTLKTLGFIPLMAGMAQTMWVRSSKPISASSQSTRKTNVSRRSTRRSSRCCRH
jgi:hypothetical protein